MQAARSALDAIVPDIRLFLSEVRFLPAEALEALVNSLLPMTMDDAGVVGGGGWGGLRRGRFVEGGW